MNKHFFKIGIVLGILVFLGACEEDRVFPEYATLEHGAYPRLLGYTSPLGKDYNYTEWETSVVSFSVEFYDDENGQTVDTYTWTASHAPTGKTAQIASKDRSQFGVNSENGRPTAEFSFALSDVLNALGLTIDDVGPGGAIDFYATLTTNRGQTFDRFNTNSVTQGQPAFRALFQFKSNLVCPSDLAGTFDAHTQAQSVWAGTPCNSTWDGTVIWVSTGAGIYHIKTVINGAELWDMSMGSYTACYGADSEGSMPNGAGGMAGNLRITDACGKMAYSGASQWGETYVINNLVVNGNQLTIDWTNSYGESAVTTLTRTDGKDWPDYLYF